MQRLREKGRRRVARFVSNGVTSDALALGVSRSSVDWRRGAVPRGTNRSHHRPHPGVVGYGEYQIVSILLVWYLLFGDFGVLAEWALRCYPESTRPGQRKH